MAGGGFVESGNGKEYPGKLTLYVTFTCIVAAMGGLIFGYDIGISGLVYLIFFFFFWFNKRTLLCSLILLGVFCCWLMNGPFVCSLIYFNRWCYIYGFISGKILSKGVQESKE